TFDLTQGDVHLYGPFGTVLDSSLVRLRDLAGAPMHNRWAIDFTAPTAAGVYTLTIGPDVTDSSGTRMDQNKNLAFGEAPAAGFPPDATKDQFVTQFVIDGLKVNALSTDGPLPRPFGTSFIDITFNTEVDPATFKLSEGDITITGPGGAVNLTGLTDLT